MLALLLFGAAGPLADPVGAQADCDPVAELLVPAFAAVDGTPFTFRYTPSACHDTSYSEVRIWLGDDTGENQASRVWDDTSWTASTRYVPVPPTDDDGGVWPAVQANPSATHADVILQAGEDATLWGQWRGDSATTEPMRLGEIGLLAADAVRPVWSNEGRIVVTGPDGDLLAAAPTGIDADGRPLPERFGYVAAPQRVEGAPPPLAPGAVLLQRVGPALAPDSWDLVELRVVDPHLTDLQGLRISDGEGELVLPPLEVPPGRVIQLVDPSAHDPPEPWSQADALRVPWSALTGLPWERVERDGSFALAKGGEAIAVTYGDVWLDTFVYGDPGDDPQPGWNGDANEKGRIDGRLFVRASDDGDLVDTDSSLDWLHPRIFRQYQHDRPADWFDVQGPVRAFVCPDRCWEEVAMRIDGAARTLDVNLYDLTLTEAVEAIADAATRGVDVRVLLHGRPVGASADHMDRLAWAVERLAAAGADVRVHDGLRFDVNHAKYLVADGEWSVVLSENAVASGWSPSGTEGNRGWGVAVRDARLADWFVSLFDHDHGHALDTHPATVEEFSTDPRPGFVGATQPADAVRRDTLVVEGPVRVRPLVAPEHLGDPMSSPLVGAIQGARHEVWTQQLNLPLDWKRPGYVERSPLVRAMEDAAARNVSVLGTLSGAFEDGDPTTAGNDQTAHVLSAHARIDLRLASSPSGHTVHNKGWLVDPVPGGRNLVVVGSANGNLASQALNREVDLMIENDRVAAYFRTVLLSDQERSVALGPSLVAPGADGPEAVAPGAAPVALLVAVCMTIVVLRRRSW